MCGIIGSVSKRITQDSFENSMKLMLKRGPDNRGISSFHINNKTVYFGHQRLSIIDLSDNGKQPFFSFDNKFVIIFNGEIYNYKELREELRLLGYQFTSETDTEVLLNSWIEWREKALEKLAGMFAFAILDLENSIITCAKDPFGIKPFFYYFDENEFFFASDILTIKNLIGKNIAINEKTAFSYIVNSKYDKGSETFLDSIFSLTPASLIKIEIGDKLKLSETVWYKPFITENNNISFKDAVDCLRSLFLESVRLHLRSDVPIGITLSGGLDSSAVACAIKYLEPDFPVNTFSYVARISKLNEEKWIDIVNANINATPNKIFFEDDAILHDLNDLVIAQGEPFSTSSIYAQYRVFKEVKEKGVTVTLDGQGGDEILCGYDGYPREIFNSLLDSNKHISAIKYLQKYNQHNSEYVSIPVEIAKRFLPQSFFQTGRKLIKGSIYPSWINDKDILEKYKFNSPQLIFSNSEIKRRRLSASLGSELTYSRIPRLLRYADRNSMNFSVESRVPFLYTKLANFMLSMPERYMVSENGESKNMFKYAMEGIVPAQILKRKDKIGFEAPEKNIVLKLHYRKSLHLEGLENLHFIDLDKVKKYVTTNLDSNHYSNIIWRLIIMSKWAEQL